MAENETAPSYQGRNEKQNLDAAQSCSVIDANVPRISEVGKKVREVFPLKSAEHLSEITGISDRSARYFLSGERDLWMQDFARLLNHPNGFVFLAALMRGSNAVWWKLICNLMAVADARAMQAKANQKLETVLAEAMNEQTTISRSITRAEALLVQDEDFYREGLDAMGAFSGAKNRTVASR